jgi:hypothetical protein
MALEITIIVCGIVVLLFGLVIAILAAPGPIDKKK